MAKKRRSHPKSKKTDTIRTKNTLWNIITIAAVIISIGLIANLTFFRSGKFANRTSTRASVALETGTYDDRVQLVASRFSCACGGCGELPLDECTCDMPRGAVEEKRFIHRELEKGRTIDEVIQAVDDTYGYRKA